jgi:hypothetical protein
LQPGPRVRLQDGQEIEGPVAGLEAVPVQLGGQAVTVDLGKALELRLAPAPESSLVWAALVVRQGDREVFRHCEGLPIAGLLPVPVVGLRSPEIRPAPLEGDKVERLLEAPVSDVAVGGAGRYFVLHLPRVQKLAVFDVNAAKVVGSIPIPEEDARFTAGLEDVVVVLPRAKTIERWSLRTLEREVAATLPVKGVIKAVAMGSASKGPLLVHAAVGSEALDSAFLALLNTETLKPIFAELNTQIATIMMGSYRDLVHLRASADGRVFGLWCTSHSPTGMGVVVYSEAVTRTFYAHKDVGYVVPSPDGKAVYTRFGNYVLQAQGQPGEMPETGGAMLPASLGDQYLNLTGAGPARGPTIEAPGKEKPIATFPDLGLPGPRDHTLPHDFTYDKHIHLVPEARLLLTIPASGDRLILSRYGG